MSYNGHIGIDLLGADNLAEGNTITKSVQHHRNDGEPASATYLDADGLNFFGHDHTIRGNFIWEPTLQPDINQVYELKDELGQTIGYNAAYPDEPHSDCFQTFHNGPTVPAASNILFDGNRCRHYGAGPKYVFTISGDADSQAHDITIQNNILESNWGIDAGRGYVNNLRLYNNTWIGNSQRMDQMGSGAFDLVEVTDYDIQNNITVDFGDHLCIDGGNGKIQNTLAWNSDNSTPWNNFGLTPDSTNLWGGSDPQFVNYDGTSDLMGGNFKSDYHLQTGSHAIDKGASLSDVTTDYAGNLRPNPNGGLWDIGAYEF
jgi:hypothetical protein